MSALEVDRRMAEAKLMLSSSWNRGVVWHVSVEVAIRIWMVVRVPALLVCVMVTPEAPLLDVVRRSKGIAVRCWRHVVGRRVKEPSP
jgi:hypothetical protein